MDVVTIVQETPSVVESQKSVVVINEPVHLVGVTEERISVATVVEEHEVVENVISVVSVLDSQVVTVGERGPQGAPGEDGPQGEPGESGSQEQIEIAGETIGGHRAVVLGSDERAYYASNLQAAHANKVLGITLGAALEDADLMVKTYGEIIEPSWNWVLGQPVFLSTNGLLTQVPPSSGFVLILGFALSATRMFVAIKEPIFLS